MLWSAIIAMKIQLVKISVVVIASLAVLAIFATGLEAVNAIASDNANTVAFGANTNQPYMQGCKQSLSAQECATGPGNNGEFTSGLAHDVNGP
jgi:hypothetical protein